MSDPHSGNRRVARFLVACVIATIAFAVAGPAQTAFAAPSIHSIIKRYTVAAGFGTLDVTAMKKIADYESHDNPKAHSRTCWGLFQLSTAMARGHAWSDASWNTRRALKYVKGRYGTPRKALAHIRKTGWY